MQRHLDACAVLRCLGTTQGRLLRLHALSFLIMTLAAARSAGLGFAAHFVLVSAMAGLVRRPLPYARRPAWSTGRWSLPCCSSVLPCRPCCNWPGAHLARPAPRTRAPARWLAGYLFGFLLLCGLIVRAAGDARLGALLALPASAARCWLFWLLAWLAIRLLGRLRGAFSAVAASAGGRAWRRWPACAARTP
jgi:putative ABC transport system permease protein